MDVIKVIFTNNLIINGLKNYINPKKKLWSRLPYIELVGFLATWFLAASPTKRSIGVKAT